MDITAKSTLDDKLGFLDRLCSGRSSLTCQYNLLVELQVLLPWDQVVLLAPPHPWIFPLNETIPFSLPDQSCPAGIWQWSGQWDQWDRSYPIDRPFQIHSAAPSQLRQDQSLTLDKAWCDWCQNIAHHYQFPNGVLMMIEISHSDGQSLSWQVPIVILRSCGAFKATEIATLRMVHDALQQIVDQAIVLESLLTHSPLSHSPKDEPEVAASEISVTSDSLPLPMDDRETCIQKCLQTLGLTPRQVEVMHLIIKGKELAAIAQELGCTEATVRKHVENLYRRLGVQTRTAAIAQVLETIGIV